MTSDQHGLDFWLAGHPWRPRVGPYLLYLMWLPLVSWGCQWRPGVYPWLYGLQCLSTFWLLWRGRRFLTELTFGFHWGSVLVGGGVAWVWIVLGRGMVQVLSSEASSPLHLFEQMTSAERGVSLGLRLLGMTLLVPVFEEVFVRSLLLRSFHRGRQVAIAAVQWCGDFPIVGDWLLHTRFVQRADRHDRPMAAAFVATPLGALSVFGVTGSTLVFTLGHVMRDWPAAILCSLAYCLLLHRTRTRGLGPVIWAHGITNALLWGYCVKTGDWQFL